MIRLTILVAILLSQAATAQITIESWPTHPDGKMTTGSYCNEQDRDFVGHRYQEQIAFCIRNVSRHLKKQVYEAYGVPEKCWPEYTIDHFIPLSMGGSNAFDNLWPEHKRVKATRQNMEQELYEELLNGNIKRQPAVAMIMQAKLNPPKVTPTRCK